MYSKLFFGPALKDTMPEAMATVMVTDPFDYAGASLCSSSDEESASLQTVLVLDFSSHQPDSAQMTEPVVSHSWQRDW